MRPTILDAISCGVQAVPVPLYQPSTVQLPQFYMSCFPDLNIFPIVTFMYLSINQLLFIQP